MDLAKIKESMTSLEIADATGKRHADVLRDMRKMSDSWLNITQRSFAFSNYKDKSGRTLPMYNLTKPQILFVASKYDDELRAKIIIRLYELEEKTKQLMQAQLDYFWDKSDQQDLYK